MNQGQRIQAQTDKIMQIAVDFTEWIKAEGEKIGIEPDEVQEIVHELMR